MASYLVFVNFSFRTVKPSITRDFPCFVIGPQLTAVKPVVAMTFFFKTNGRLIINLQENLRSSFNRVRAGSDGQPGRGHGLSQVLL